MNLKDETSKGISSRTNDFVGRNSEMDNKNLCHNRPFLRKTVSPQTGKGLV